MRRHDIDPTSLVFGVVFLTLATLWALRETDIVSTSTAAASVPVLLVTAGVLGLIGTVSNARRHQATSAANRQPEDP
ncbi:MAG: hypothetical protein ACRC35_13730 [Angustibacter sp.]